MYEFEIYFKLPESLSDVGEIMERLADAGCTDCTLGSGRPSHLAMVFDRDSSSAFDAISSAIADISRCIGGMKHYTLGPDLVGLSDVAAILDVSRQNMRKLWLAHSATFPDATYLGAVNLWHLDELLIWLSTYQNWEIPAEMLETARTVRAINAAREQRQTEPVDISQLELQVA